MVEPVMCAGYCEKFVVLLLVGRVDRGDFKE